MEACPVDAIFAVDQLPSEWLGYAQINADYTRLAPQSDYAGKV